MTTTKGATMGTDDLSTAPRYRLCYQGREGKADHLDRDYVLGPFAGCDFATEADAEAAIAEMKADWPNPDVDGIVTYGVEIVEGA